MVVAFFRNAENNKKKGIAMNIEVDDPNVIPRTNNTSITVTLRSFPMREV
jgi:hypothetical protein